MTAVDVSWASIAALDFPASCEGCENPATYKVKLDCGCIGLFCLRCLKVFEQRIHNCDDYARARGMVPFFDCADCTQRIWGWPIAAVTAL